MGNNPQSYKRSLRLGPALGDWTRLRAIPEERHTISTPIPGFDRLSEDELRLAHLIHYRFFEDVARELSQTLEIHLSLGEVAASQMPYRQFLEEIYSPLVHINGAVRTGGTLGIYFDVPFGEMIVHHLLGASNGAFSGRALTDIDQSLVLTGLRPSLQKLAAAYGGRFPIEDFSLESSTGVVRDYGINLQDNYVVFSARFLVEQDQTTSWGLSIGYVQSLIKTGLEKAQPLGGVGALRLDRLPAPILESYKVPVIVELGVTTVTMSELHELQPGDVVPLDLPLHHPVTLRLGESIVLPAQPGLVHGHLSAKMLKSRVPLSESVGTVMALEELSDEPLETELPAETTPKTFDWLQGGGDNGENADEEDLDDDDLLEEDDEDDDESEEKKDEKSNGKDDWLSGDEDDKEKV